MMIVKLIRYINLHACCNGLLNWMLSFQTFNFSIPTLIYPLGFYKTYRLRVDVGVGLYFYLIIDSVRLTGPAIDLI